MCHSPRVGLRSFEATNLRCLRPALLRVHVATTTVYAPKNAVVRTVRRLGFAFGSEEIQTPTLARGPSLPRGKLVLQRPVENFKLAANHSRSSREIGLDLNAEPPLALLCQVSRMQNEQTSKAPKLPARKAESGCVKHNNSEKQNRSQSLRL